MDKRTFLKGMALGSVGLPFTLSAMAERISRFDRTPAQAIAMNEEFWTSIRSGYRLKPDYINLENGYYNIQPGEILEAFIAHVKAVNYEGSYYMRTVQFERKKAIVARLASLAGCWINIKYIR